MKRPYALVALTLCASLSLAGPLRAALYDAQDPPISPLEYSALLGLRDMDPDLFRTKLMPLIDKAMQDGMITRSELASIEKAAGNVAKAFYEAARAPRFQDSFNQVMEKAEKSGRNLGDKLNQTFTEDVPKLFNETVDLFRQQLQQYRKDNPQPETSL